MPAEETTSRLAEWRHLVHPQDLARTEEDFDTALRGGDYDSEFRVQHPDGSYRWVSARGRVFYDPSGRPLSMVGVLQDITVRKQSEDQLRLLMDELNHRVKNTLATVQSIAGQTARTAGDPQSFRRSFENRLLALSKTHDLLTRNAWRMADLRAVIEQELMPYRRETNDRIAVKGPAVSVPARGVINLGLVIHELVTNAAKYGALSVSEGRLEVSWAVTPTSDGETELHLHWHESDGPAVQEPQRRGFGSRLIERTIEGELNGRAKLHFLPTGLRAEFVFVISPSEGDPVDEAGMPPLAAAV
jgi:two-component sensor histidine kinase